MPIPSEDRHMALVSAAELLEGVEDNFKTIAEIKAKYPHIPKDVMEYIEATGFAMKMLVETLVMSNEKILEFDDAVDKVLEDQQKEGE